jgi:hypothetical protein
MTEHGFSSPIYTLDDSLAVLKKLGLSRPVFGDGLLVGEQHPEKYLKGSIMFPHEPVLDSYRLPSVIYLWGGCGDRELSFSQVSGGWLTETLVAGVREL